MSVLTESWQDSALSSCGRGQHLARGLGVPLLSHGYSEKASLVPWAGLHEGGSVYCPHIQVQGSFLDPYFKSVRRV